MLILATPVELPHLTGMWERPDSQLAIRPFLRT
jgi:hypothetical protein